MEFILLETGDCTVSSRVILGTAALAPSMHFCTSEGLTREPQWHRADKNGFSLFFSPALPLDGLHGVFTVTCPLLSFILPFGNWLILKPTSRCRSVYPTSSIQGQADGLGLHLSTSHYGAGFGFCLLRLFPFRVEPVSATEYACGVSTVCKSWFSASTK